MVMHPIRPHAMKQETIPVTIRYTDGTYACVGVLELWPSIVVKGRRFWLESLRPPVYAEEVK